MSVHEDEALAELKALVEDLTSEESDLVDTIVRAHDEHDARGEMWREVRTRIHGHPDGIPGVEREKAAAMGESKSLFDRIMEAKRRGSAAELLGFKPKGSTKATALARKKAISQGQAQKMCGFRPCKPGEKSAREQSRSRKSRGSAAKALGFRNGRSSVSDVVSHLRQLADTLTEGKKNPLADLLSSWSQYVTAHADGANAATVMTTNKHLADMLAADIKKSFKVPKVDVKRVSAGFRLSWAKPLSVKEWSDEGYPHHVLVELDDYYFMTCPDEDNCAMHEARDFPSKYASVPSGSGRSGVGTAPVVDTRPDAETREAEQADHELKKVRELRRRALKTR